ncbi:Zinc finger protein rst2 [Colletotrichum gloeosporioides]|uniref:Zinc finger protein rst2 n=1 Tax=Colletotrichum gloeosporioides TaxID=474922 RepID=A0A8H4CQZ3_COLGL|nr:Zinc finger protein rst2 [Colletotrichum gloeosporioides]KAF3808525.1 Zinc finger protein rst2 [Colletotrichum gloeosporioides]
MEMQTDRPHISGGFGSPNISNDIYGLIRRRSHMFVNAVHLSLGETCYSVTSDFIMSQIAILLTMKTTFHRRVVSTTQYPREQC